MNDGNCRTSFGESRIALIDKYVRCTETALRNAQFLKSYDIAVLQALTLYLVSRQYPDNIVFVNGMLACNETAVRLTVLMATQRNCCSCWPEDWPSS